MTLPLIIASGQGILPFLMFGIPAGIIGFTCLISATVLVLKKKKESDRAVLILGVSGVVLVAFVFFSPGLDPAAHWLLERIKPK